MQNLPVALQVYTVRDSAEADFAGTMRQIKEMGYDGVELAGMYDHSAAEIKEALAANDLRAVSAHVPIHELLADAEGTIDKYVEIGCEYIAIPYLPPEMQPASPDFDQLLEKVDRMGALCKERGVTLLYHNHDFEFVKMPDGSFGLDYIYTKIPADRLQTELDVCWIKVAGQSPVEYIEKYASRCPIVHLKDYYKEGETADMYDLIGIDKAESAEDAKEGVFEFRPVGYGVQDFPSVLAAALKSGAKWVVVEQDMSVGRTPMEAAKLSREYLKSQGW